MSARTLTQRFRTRSFFAVAPFIGAAEDGLRYLGRELGVPALVGQSLGTAAAVEMALRGYGSKLVPISPFTSMVDMAQRRPRMSGMANAAMTCSVQS